MRTGTIGSLLASRLDPDLLALPGAELAAPDRRTSVACAVSLFQTAGAHPGESLSTRVARELRPARSELPDHAIHGLDKVFIKGHLHRLHRAPHCGYK